MPKKYEQITKSEFSRRMDVTPGNVTRWIKEGKLKGCMTPDNKKILWPRGRDQVNSLLNPMLQKGINERWGKGPPKEHQPTPEQVEKTVKKSGVDSDPGFQDTTAGWQKLKLKYEAAFKKLEYDIKLGKYIEAEKVEKENFEIGQMLREGFDGISERISALVAVESDQHTCREILYKEHNRLLTEVCTRLSKKVS